MQFFTRFALLTLTLALAATVHAQETSFNFVFGGRAVAAGEVAVRADMLFDKARGYGFEPSAAIEERDRDATHESFVTSAAPFKFSVVVPPGNYRVAVTLGDGQGESLTTVKAETRRLVLERIHTAMGKLATCTFAVNVRNPQLSAGNQLKLDTREWNPETGEAVNATWDDRLTLEFSDECPCVCGVKIEKVDDAVTVFLVGDSTVTDQGSEPYGTWGQMLPHWFKLTVAVANHAESGQTLKGFRAQGRWFKVMSELKRGDYVFMQFGHNDLNQSGHDGIWPRNDTMGDWVNTYSEANTDYKWLLASYAVEVKRRGGIPVIVTPMTKYNLRIGEPNPAGLGDYPQAAAEAAKLAGVACIDLNAMSIALVKTLGPELAPRVYVDGLHSTSYGGYLFARCIVAGIKNAQLDLAKHLTDDAGEFDPQHPQPLPDAFKLPLGSPPPHQLGTHVATAINLLPSSP